MRNASLASCLIAIASLLSAASGHAAPSTSTQLQVHAGRASTVAVWVPEHVRGVVLFSSGHGSWPERYERLLDGWRDAGFAVVAPLHVDSVRHPDRERFSMQQGFIERMADMRAASDYAAARWPGLPVAAAGHSYGTLVSLCLGGALAELAPLRDPRVSLVLGYSSPGKIPGLVGPRAYAGVEVPFLIVTGDADLVPGFVTDWRDHLYPVESAPQGHASALVLEGGDHVLIGAGDGSRHLRASEVGTAFLQAGLLDDARAARLLQEPDREGETWIRR